MPKMITLSAFALTLTLGSAALAGPDNRERRGGAEMLNKDHYAHNRYYRRANRDRDESSASPSDVRRPSHQDGGAINATRHPSMIVASGPSRSIRR